MSVLDKPHYICPFCDSEVCAKVEHPKACAVCKRYFTKDHQPQWITKPIDRKVLKTLPIVEEGTKMQKIQQLCVLCQEEDITTSTYGVGILNGQWLCERHLLDKLKER